MANKIKDRAGQVHGALKFIKVSHQKNDGSAVWILECLCGQTVKRNARSVLNSKNPSCGCDIHKYAGKKFNRLTLINKTNSQLKSGTYLWLAQCACGNKCLVDPSAVIRKCINSCGCFHKENVRKLGLSKRQYTPIVSNARLVWSSHYADGNIDFDLFYEMSQFNCHYCGDPPKNRYNNLYTIKSGLRKDEDAFVYNGLDRVDNSLKHDIKNVVPCCGECNLMKSDHSYDEFITKIHKIAGRHNAPPPKR